MRHHPVTSRWPMPCGTAWSVFKPVLKKTPTAGCTASPISSTEGEHTLRIARFVHRDEFAYGVIQDQVITVLATDPLYAAIVPTNETLKLDDVRLLSPVLLRSKFVGVSRNWHAHAYELGNEVPSSPLLYFKPNTPVVGQEESVMLPDWTEEVFYEAELAFVIGP